MKKIGIIGGGNFGATLAAELATRQIEPLHIDHGYLHSLLDATLLADHQAVLIVGNDVQADQVRLQLQQLRREGISVLVGNLDTNELDRFGYPMDDFKPMQREYEFHIPARVEPAFSDGFDGWRQPKHRSIYTKAEPTRKARKAARRRAKSGRKINR